MMAITLKDEYKPILKLLAKHSHLKLSLIRQMTKTDGLKIHDILHEMIDEKLIKYDTETDHFKFRGYVLTDLGKEFAMELS